MICCRDPPTANSRSRKTASLVSKNRKRRAMKGTDTSDANDDDNDDDGDDDGDEGEKEGDEEDGEEEEEGLWIT